MTTPTRSPLHPTFVEARIFIRPEAGDAHTRDAGIDERYSNSRNASDTDWMCYCVAQHLI